MDRFTVQALAAMAALAIPSAGLIWLGRILWGTT